MNPRKPERRQKARFDVEGLQGGLRLPMDARVVDLSVDGIGVETDRWLQVGRSYTVSLPMEEGTLRLPGAVAWCVLARTVKNAKGESAPLYKAGIQFQEPDAAGVKQIERLLAKTARVGFEDPMRGRFRYRQEAAVNVVLEDAFTVLKLSLTGMLVEADLLPELETRYQVALHVGDEVLEATTRVAFVDRDPGFEGGSGARIGLEFVDLEPAQRRLLSELVGSEIGSSSARFVGNPKTSIYHRPACRYAAACTLPFRSRRQAEAAGLRPGGCCLPERLPRARAL
ncbi:MAG TPA: PilZ domain-containing protein [Thermoanaerobaculia bacterium]|nr:PilZ domain-containing protein [Thermoanaerobaculia bacterium]